MARALPPAMVIAQASAHTKPRFDEYKVVNWLRAAAIIARIDPVALGYLKQDSRGVLRLPPLRKLGTGVNLNEPTPGHTNLLAEYTIDSLSDSDLSFSVPVVADAQVLIAKLAPEFGYNLPVPGEDPTRYNTKYRNVVLSQLTAERLLLVYAHGGLPAVQDELARLRRHKLI
jgi:hypothetical protein